MELLTFDDDLGSIVSTSAAMAATAHGNDVFAVIFTSQRLVLLSVQCAAGNGVVTQETARFHWQAAHPMEAVTLSPDGTDLLIVTSDGPAYLLPVHMLLALHQKKKRNDSDDDASAAASKAGQDTHSQAEELLYMNTALLPQAKHSDRRESSLQEDLGMDFGSVELDKSTHGEPSANSCSINYARKGSEANARGDIDSKRTSFSGSEVAETVLSDDMGLGDLEVEGSAQVLAGNAAGTPTSMKAEPCASLCCTWWRVLADHLGVDSNNDAGRSNNNNADDVESSSLSQVHTRLLAGIARGTRLTFYERVPLGFEDRLQLSLGGLGAHCPDGALPANTLVPVPIRLDNLSPAPSEHRTQWAMRLAAPVQSLASFGGPHHRGLLATCLAADSGSNLSATNEITSNASNNGIGNGHGGGFVLSHTPRNWQFKHSANGSAGPKPSMRDITYSDRDLPASPSSLNSAAEVQPLYIGVCRLTLPPLGSSQFHHLSTTSAHRRADTVVCGSRTLVPLVDGFMSESITATATPPTSAAPLSNPALAAAAGSNQALTLGVLNGICMDLFCVPIPMPGDGAQWMGYDDWHANMQAGEQTDSTSGDDTDHEAAFSADIAAIMSALGGGNHLSLDANIAPALHTTAPVHGSSNSTFSVDDLGIVLDTLACSTERATPRTFSTTSLKTEEPDPSGVPQTITNGSVSFLGRILLGNTSGYGRGDKSDATVVAVAAAALSKSSLPLVGVGSRDGSVALSQPLWHLGFSPTQNNDSCNGISGSGSSGRSSRKGSIFPAAVACAPLAVETYDDHKGSNCSFFSGLAVAGTTENRVHSSSGSGSSTRGNLHLSRGVGKLGVTRALVWTAHAVHFLEVPSKGLSSTNHHVSAEMDSSSQLFERSSSYRAAWALREALTQARRGRIDSAVGVAQAALHELNLHRDISNQKVDSDRNAASISGSSRSDGGMQELNEMPSTFEENHGVDNISDSAMVGHLLAARLASLLVVWQMARLRRAEAHLKYLWEGVAAAEALAPSPMLKPTMATSQTPSNQALESQATDELLVAEATVVAARAKLEALVLVYDENVNADSKQGSHDTYNIKEFDGLCARALTAAPFPIVALLVAGAEPAQAAAAAADEAAAELVRAKRVSAGFRALPLDDANAAAIAAAIQTASLLYADEDNDSVEDEEANGVGSVSRMMNEKVFIADEIATTLFGELPFLALLTRSEEQPGTKRDDRHLHSRKRVDHLAPSSWSRSLGLRLAASSNCLPAALEVIARAAAAAATVRLNSQDRSNRTSHSTSSNISTQPFLPLASADVEWLLVNGWGEAFAVAGNGQLAWELPLMGRSSESTSGDGIIFISSNTSNGHNNGPHRELGLVPRALRLRACLTSPPALAPHRAWVRAALPTAAALDSEFNEHLCSNGNSSSDLNGVSVNGSNHGSGGSDGVLGPLTRGETDFVLDTLALWCGLLDCTNTASNQILSSSRPGNSDDDNGSSDGGTCHWRSLGHLNASLPAKINGLPRAQHGGPDDADMLLGCLMDLASSSHSAADSVSPSLGNDGGGKNGTSTATQAHETLMECCVALAGHYRCAAVVGALADRALWLPAAVALEAHGDWPLALEMRLNALIDHLGTKEWPEAPSTSSVLASVPASDISADQRDEMIEEGQNVVDGANNSTAKNGEVEGGSGISETETETTSKASEGALALLLKSHVLNRPAGEGGDGVWDLILNAWQCPALGSPRLAQFEAIVLARIAAEQAAESESSRSGAVESRSARRFMGFMLRRGREHLEVGTTDTTAAATSSASSVPTRAPASAAASSTEKSRFNSQRLPPFSPKFLLSVTRAAAAAATVSPESTAARNELEAQWNRTVSTLHDARGFNTSSGSTGAGTRGSGSFQAPSRHEALPIDPALLTAARATTQNTVSTGRFYDRTTSPSTAHWSRSKARGQSPATLSPVAVFSCGHALTEDSLKVTEHALVEFVASQNADAVATAVTSARSGGVSKEVAQRIISNAKEAQRLADLYRSRPVLGVACPKCSGAAALVSELDTTGLT